MAWGCGVGLRRIAMAWGCGVGSRCGVLVCGRGMGLEHGVVVWGHGVGLWRVAVAWGHGVWSWCGAVPWGHGVGSWHVVTVQGRGVGQWRRVGAARAHGAGGGCKADRGAGASWQQRGVPPSPAARAALAVPSRGRGLRGAGGPQGLVYPGPPRWPDPLT